MLSCVQFFETLWNVAHQTPMFMGFFRKEYCSGLSFPPLGYLPNPGIKLMSPASPILAGIGFTTEPPGKPLQFSSVASNFLRPHGLQHARLPCPSPTPGVYSHSCPLSQWCHPTISSSVVPFSSRLQSFPASGYFKMSQFFTLGGNPLLLLSRFSRVRLCATPQMAAYQGPPSLGFSRQEHWSRLPFPSPMHESEEWKCSHSVMSDS